MDASFPILMPQRKQARPAHRVETTSAHERAPRPFSKAIFLPRPPHPALPDRVAGFISFCSPIRHPSVCKHRQGPFTIAPGGQREIPFRNVFASAMDFTFTCDNPAFAVISGDRQNVAAKTSKSVSIKFTPPSAAPAQVNAVRILRNPLPCNRQSHRLGSGSRCCGVMSSHVYHRFRVSVVRPDRHVLQAWSTRLMCSAPLLGVCTNVG